MPLHTWKSNLKIDFRISAVALGDTEHAGIHIIRKIDEIIGVIRYHIRIKALKQNKKLQSLLKTFKSDTSSKF